MKAITTRYAGPTNTRGSRIIASEPDGKRLTLSYDSSLDSETNHRVAAEALRDKLGWTGSLVGGYIGQGRYAWVFTTEER